MLYRSDLGLLGEYLAAGVMDIFLLYLGTTAMMCLYILWIVNLIVNNPAFYTRYSGDIFLLTTRLQLRSIILHLLRLHPSSQIPPLNNQPFNRPFSEPKILGGLFPHVPHPSKRTNQNPTKHADSARELEPRHLTIV